MAAKLTYADLAKRSNMHKFVDKVFARKGDDGEENINHWKTEDGLFVSESVIIDNVEYKKYDSDLPQLLISFPNNPGIDLVGHYKGGRKDKVRLTKLFKTGEFGGQGSQGNKGHQFEAMLDNALKECVEGNKCKDKFAKEAEHLIDLVTNALKESVTKVTLEGGRNQPRPLKVQGDMPYVEPATPKDHGQRLTDITLTMGKSGMRHAYLSLKSGSTLTFMNSGVARDFFIQSEMKGGLVKNRSGIAVLQAFGLDNAKFCQVFNQYGSGKVVNNHVVDVTKMVDKRKLTKFMQTAIGANYFMIHELQGRIYYYHISEEKNRQYANIDNCKLIAYYGGKQGNGKRIDVEFSNSFYDFKMNIRNKQGGTYPSHIMLDYVAKSAVEKIVL